MKNNKITSLIFILILALLTILSFITPTRLYSENENRYLAQKPVFNVKNFFSNNYSKNYEEFLNDQFVFKDTWVEFKTYLELLLQKKEINNVYIAKDGYFIEKHDENSVDNIQLEKNINFLNNYIKNAEKVYDENHLKVLISPLASEILKDKLPLFASNYNQNVILDKIITLMPDNFIDVRNTLSEYKNEYIYYKTDHHLTTLGTYYLYLDIAKAYGFEPLAIEDFKITKVSDNFLGTTIAKVNIKNSYDDIFIFEPIEKNEITVTYNLTDKTTSLYAEDKLQTKDQYAYFLGGNNAFVEINTDIKNGKNLFIIKDSYANCLIPFLVNHFENIYVVDLRYININIPEYSKKLNTTDILILYNAINFSEDKYIVKLAK